MCSIRRRACRARGEHAGDSGDHDAADAEVPREIDACTPPLPPNAISVEVARILAALNRHRADRARHVGVGDRRMPCAASATDSLRGRATCASIAFSLTAPVDRERTAGQRTRVDESRAPYWRRSRSAARCRGRSRPAPGRRPRFRPDDQQAALVDAAIEPPPAPTSAISIAGTLSI